MRLADDHDRSSPKQSLAPRKARPVSMILETNDNVTTVETFPRRRRAIVDFAKDEAALIKAFGDTLHSAGTELAALVRVDTSVVLRGGKLITLAFEEYGSHGRGSRFKRWLQCYCPDLSRTTADRWRKAYETFHEAFEQDPSLFQNVSLSALYAVVERGEQEHREELVNLAKGRKRVTFKAVQEFLPPKVKSATPRAAQDRQQTNVKASLHLVCLNEDLAAAIRELEQRGYEYHSVAVGCRIAEDGGSDTVTLLVNGTRGGAKPNNQDLCDWFSIKGSSDDVVRLLVDRHRLLWPRSQVETFYVDNSSDQPTAE